MTDRKLPTKEEMLNGIRERARAAADIASDRNAIEPVYEPDTGTNEQDRRANDSRPGTSRQFERRDRIDESAGRGTNGTNGAIPNSDGRLGNDGRGTNEYQQRYATGSDASPGSNIDEQQQYTPPITKQRGFRPYYSVIADALRNKDKSKAKSKRPKARLLTDAEIKLKREKFIQFILWLSEHTDDVIQATSKGHAYVEIWRDIDRDDATIIADYLLSKSKTEEKYAYIVREMLELENRIKMGAIILPRVYRTIMHYFEVGGISIR